MLAVVVIPTEDYYEEQAHGNSSANGGAGNTGDNKADKGEHTVNRSIGQLGAHMVHQITFCAHRGQNGSIAQGRAMVTEKAAAKHRA